MRLIILPRRHEFDWLPTSTARSLALLAPIFVVLVSWPNDSAAQSSMSHAPGFSVLERNAQSADAVADDAEPAVAEPADAGADIDNLLTKLVLENMPHEFEETKDWGGQDERWDGVKIRREGWKIETKRRKKLVNHGTWKKYAAHLRNPQEEFTVQIKNMRETAAEKLAFDVHFLAHLNIAGRQSKWVKGVQLYSIGVEGHTKMRLVVSIELEVKMGGAAFPPDLIFVPVATNADIIVDEFRIDHVGKAGGEFAQQVTKGVRSKLDEKVAEKQAKLLTKINSELVDNQDKLRISIADAMKSKWTKTAQAFLPASVQESLQE